MTMIVAVGKALTKKYVIQETALMIDRLTADDRQNNHFTKLIIVSYVRMYEKQILFLKTRSCF